MTCFNIVMFGLYFLWKDWWLYHCGICFLTYHLQFKHTIDNLSYLNTFIESPSSYAPNHQGVQLCTQCLILWRLRKYVLGILIDLVIKGSLFYLARSWGRWIVSERKGSERVFFDSSKYAVLMEIPQSMPSKYVYSAEV